MPQPLPGCWRTAGTRPCLWCLLAIFVAAKLARGQCIEVANVTDSIVTPFIPPAYDCKLVFDSARGVTVAVEEDTGVVFLYDGHSWTQAPYQDVLPKGLSGAAWVYDSVRHVSLLYGGYADRNEPDLYSHDTVTWRQVTWTGISPPASPALGAFDPNRGRAIFLLPDGANYQTWEWTGSAWEQGPTLSGAKANSFVFATRHNIGFVSGTDPNGDQEAVWLYSPGATAAQSTWTQASISGAPNVSRIGTALAYDFYRDRVIRCFGRDYINIFGFTSEIFVWDWTNSRWNLFSSLPGIFMPGVDESRADAGATYDLNRDKLVMYGGLIYHADPNTGGYQYDYHHDTWEEKFNDPTLLVSSDGTSSHCEGETAVFALSAGGDNLTYEWFHNAVLIPNANASVLVLKGLATADSGNYVGRAKNDCGYIDTPIIRLRVKAPIALHRPALFPDCSLTCLGSDVSIFPPDPRDLSLNMHLQKWSPGWVDVRVSTPSAPTNFVFHNVQTNFTGNYRFYIDGSPCDPYLDSEHWIQIGFDISKQPVSLSNVPPCSYPTFTVGWLGACGFPQYHWFKDNFQFLSEDDGHFRGVHTDTLRIEGARYEDEGSYGCILIDTNQCNYTNISLLATLRLVPSQWVLRSTTGPPARYGHAMVYDNARGVTVLFGGERLSDDHSRYENFGDVWEWNGANWRQRTTFSATSGWVLQTNTGYWYPAYDVPVPRVHHAMAYDTKRGRVVLFGGGSIPPNGVEALLFLADTWEWDGLACNSAQPMAPRLASGTRWLTTRLEA